MNKVMVFVSSNLVWLLLIPGAYLYYGFRGGRGDYPPFADNIGFALWMEVAIYFFLMIPLNLVLIIATLGAKLPAMLLPVSDRNDMPVLLLDMFFGFCLLVNMLITLTLVYDGDHVAIFVSVFFTYVLLTLRAGQISKWM